MHDDPWGWGRAIESSRQGSRTSSRTFIRAVRTPSQGRSADHMINFLSHVRLTGPLPVRNPDNPRDLALSLALYLCFVLMASAFDNGLRRSVASVPLKYSIAAASEHSGVYVASNILRDEPTDSTSRWSGASQIPHVKQWVTLRLDDLAILSLVPFIPFFSPVDDVLRADRIAEGITFGKVRYFLDLDRFPIFAGFKRRGMCA